MSAFRTLQGEGIFRLLVEGFTSGADLSAGMAPPSSRPLGGPNEGKRPDALH